jgi:hypothetical protein
MVRNGEFREIRGKKQLIREQWFPIKSCA